MKETPVIPQQEASHGSQPEETYQRACLRNLGRTWPRGRSSRPALARGRARNPGDIGGDTSPKRRPTNEKIHTPPQEAPRAGTCEDRQHARTGELTPRRGASALNPENAAPCTSA